MLTAPRPARAEDCDANVRLDTGFTRDFGSKFNDSDIDATRPQRRLQTRTLAGFSCRSGSNTFGWLRLGARHPAGESADSGDN